MPEEPEPTTDPAPDSDDALKGKVKGWFKEAMAEYADENKQKTRTKPAGLDGGGGTLVTGFEKLFGKLG